MISLRNSNADVSRTAFLLLFCVLLIDSTNGIETIHRWVLQFSVFVRHAEDSARCTRDILDLNEFFPKS